MSNQHECTQERFLDDVKDHQISIEKDDGVHRFVRFRRANGSPYWFDLITWPGHLCISGDCGTYVFSREHDMFGFFSMDDGDFNKKKGVLLNINPGYWGEKLQSIGTNAGYRKFDKDAFESRVKEHFENYMIDDLDDEEKNALWDAIKDDVIYHADDEHAAYDAVHTFDYEGTRFVDFFDGGGTEKYTFHFIWNLYAIVWGIMKYDETKKMVDICKDCGGEDTTCGTCDGTGYWKADYPNDPDTCAHDGLLIMDNGFSKPARCSDCGCRV